MANATGQLQNVVVAGEAFACFGPCLREVRACADCAVAFIHRRFNVTNRTANVVRIRIRFLEVCKWDMYCPIVLPFFPQMRRMLTLLVLCSVARRGTESP